jgi:hypothetical protein
MKNTKKSQDYGIKFSYHIIIPEIEVLVYLHNEEIVTTA